MSYIKPSISLFQDPHKSNIVSRVEYANKNLVNGPLVKPLVGGGLVPYASSSASGTQPSTASSVSSDSTLPLPRVPPGGPSNHLDQQDNVSVSFLTMMEAELGGDLVKRSDCEDADDSEQQLAVANHLKTANSLIGSSLRKSQVETDIENSLSRTVGFSGGGSSDVAPHSWLCEGRLLLLHDPVNTNNRCGHQCNWFHFSLKNFPDYQ